MSATGTTAIDRVPRQAAASIDDWIKEGAIQSVAMHARNGGTIERRLRRLDREWGVERWLETGSAALSLAGLLLGVALNPWWFLLTVGAQMFFLQHALQGWCPPLPILRRLGWRTRGEIARERYALKALRGDFDGLGDGGPGAARRAFAAAG